VVGAVVGAVVGVGEVSNPVTEVRPADTTAVARPALISEIGIDPCPRFAVTSVVTDGDGTSVQEQAALTAGVVRSNPAPENRSDVPTTTAARRRALTDELLRQDLLAIRRTRRSGEPGQRPIGLG
jgi:hypothetical protein